MLSIYTYPNNINTGYIDPQYWGSSTVNSETGYYRRINDLKVRSVATGGIFNPVDTVSDLITITGEFYKGVDTETPLENLQIDSYWRTPLITIESQTIQSNVVSGANLANGVRVELVSSLGFTNGSAVTPTGLNGTLAEWNNTVLYANVIGNSLDLFHANGFPVKYFTQLLSEPVEVNSLSGITEINNIQVYDGLMKVRMIGVPNSYSQAAVSFNASLTNTLLQTDLINMNELYVSTTSFNGGIGWWNLKDASSFITVDDIVLNNGIPDYIDYGHNNIMQGVNNWTLGDQVLPDYQVVQLPSDIDNNDNWAVPVPYHTLQYIQKSDENGVWHDGLKNIPYSAKTILIGHDGDTAIPFENSVMIAKVGSQLGRNFDHTYQNGYLEAEGNRGVGHGYRVWPGYDTLGNQINGKRGEWVAPAGWPASHSDWKAHYIYTNLSDTPSNEVNPDSGTYGQNIDNPQVSNKWFQTTFQTPGGPYTARTENTTNGGMPPSVAPLGLVLEDIGGTPGNPTKTNEWQMTRSAIDPELGWWNGLQLDPIETAGLSSKSNLSFNWANGTSMYPTSVDISFPTASVFSSQDYGTTNLSDITAWAIDMYKAYNYSTQLHWNTNILTDPWYRNGIYIDLVKDSDPTLSIGMNLVPISTYNSGVGITVDAVTGYTTLRCMVFNKDWDNPDLVAGSPLVDLSGASIGKNWIQSDWYEQTWNPVTLEYNETADFDVFTSESRDYNIITFANFGYPAQSLNAEDLAFPGATAMSEFTIQKANNTTLWSMMRTGTRVVANSKTFYVMLKTSSVNQKTFTIHNEQYFPNNDPYLDWSLVGTMTNSELSNCFIDGTTWFVQSLDPNGQYVIPAPGQPAPTVNQIPSGIIELVHQINIPGTFQFSEANQIRYLDCNDLDPVIPHGFNADLGNAGTFVGPTTGNIEQDAGALHGAANPHVWFGGYETFMKRTGANSYVADAQVADIYYEIDDPTPYKFSEMPGYVAPTYTVTTDSLGYIQALAIPSAGVMTSGKKMLTFEAGPDTYTPPVPTPAEEEDVFDTQDQWASDSDTTPSKEWPHHVTPMSAEITYNSPTIANLSQSGVKYTRSVGHTKWRLDVEYPPMTAEDFTTFNAIAQAAHGQSTPFNFVLTGKNGENILWKDFHDQTNTTTHPRFVDLVSPGDTTALLGGFSSNEANAYVQGEVFADGGNENGRLHTVLNQVDSNVYGEAKIRTPWPFRTSVPIGTATQKSPYYAVVTLANDNFTFTVDMNNYYYVNVSFDLDGWK